MVDVKLSQLMTSSPASVAAGAAFWSGEAFIQGLQLEYVSATQIRVGIGAAFIPDAGYAVELAAALTKTITGIGNNAWGHVYLVYAAGVATDVEVVTTAPANPYYGAARVKSGAGGTSRRYLGSFRTLAGGQLQNFVHDGTRVYYQGSYPQPLTNGTATVETPVSLADSIPVSARVASLRHTNNSTSSASRMNNATGPAFPSFLANFAPGADAFIDFVVNADKSVTYWNGTSPSPSGVYIAVIGYVLER